MEHPNHSAGSWTRRRVQHRRRRRSAHALRFRCGVSRQCLRGQPDAELAQPGAVPHNRVRHHEAADQRMGRGVFGAADEVQRPRPSNSQQPERPAAPCGGGEPKLELELQSERHLPCALSNSAWLRLCRTAKPADGTHLSVPRDRRGRRHADPQCRYDHLAHGAKRDAAASGAARGELARRAWLLTIPLQ